MLLAAQPRARNRALINSLANGAPPYTEQEALENHISTNVNTLESCDVIMTGTRHISNAICSADPLFSISLDYGPKHKSLAWGKIIEKAINKRLKNSVEFYDLREGVCGSVVLHGVGPSIWEDKERWLQTELGIEDVLMPSGTLRSLRDLPLFAVYRSYTVNQLWKMTQGPRVDPAWNMPLVDAALEWVHKQTGALMSDQWKDEWYPEKRVERLKEDGGWYASDRVPTIDAYDLFFWNDNGKKSGWNRRIIMDAWGSPGVGQLPNDSTQSSRRKDLDFAKGNFLYNSGDRVYADKLDKIIHFQFGDASAVRPARYHAIRSLGFLTYAVCHLQNRLKCKFSDAVFESLMQYFRVNDPADRDRLQEIDLVHMGILPEGLQFVDPNQRWKIDQPLVTEAISMNRQTIADQSSSFSQDYDDDNGEGETATRTMAKVNSQASLVSSMVGTIYYREEARFREIMRRFFIKNSKDADVRDCRIEILKAGVPEEALSIERLDLQINKVMGGGNRMLEIATAEKLYATRTSHGPEAQVEIQTIYDAAVTGDWKLAKSLNPDIPHISDSVHDTEITFGALMSGSQVSPRPGLNPIEVCQTMLRLIQGKIQQIMQSGGVGTPQDVQGLGMAAQYCGAFIQQLAQDKEQKPVVKEFGDALGKMMNEVKGMAQRQQQAAEKAQAQNGQGDPAAMAKVQATVMQAQAKIQQGTQSHANKTAQRQLSWEQQQRQKADDHASKLKFEADKHAMELARSATELSIDQKKAELELQNRKKLFESE